MSSSDKELNILRQQLAEACATLEAIRRGEVDAVMVELGDSAEVFTLQSADLPYREFIEQMAEGALSLDREHTILYCNRFFCELLGIEREDLVGHSLMDWLDGPSRDVFEQVISEGRPCTVGGTLMRQAGDPLPVRLAINPARSNGNRRTNVVIADQRITHRLLHVTEARDAAVAASSAKDRFLAVLGHELRNPLAALTSAVAVLTHGSVDDTRRASIHQSMARQLTQLKSLVDDLLDLTRVAQGKIVLKKEQVQLPAVVAHAVESVEAMLAERDHELRLGGVPGDLVIEADRTRLEQIIVNLLSNAAKYSSPGSAIEVRAEERDDTFEISVSDKGIGLDAEDLQHIFEPFAQLGEEGSGGLGIGLTLVRQLVELHGGTVHAESEGRDRGATFHVVLPHERSHIVHETPATSEEQTLEGLRVLVVDDHEDSAELLAMLLDSHGFVTEVVNTGQEVPGAVARHRPGLVLLDLGLPDVSGYDVAKELREAGYERLVIIALTGFSHQDARTRVQEVGFDAHIVKPLTFTHLLEQIDKFRDRLV